MKTPSSTTVIDLAHIRELCHHKSVLTRFVSDNHERLESKRDWTEGLAKSIDVDQHPWSYVRTRSGWLFTCRELGRRVSIRRDGRGNDAFSSKELCTWLHSCDAKQYGRINETIIENWLCRAMIQGCVKGLDDPPGYFRIPT